MDQTFAAQDNFERRIAAEEHDAEEVVDAFDHVLDALDQVILLAELARPKRIEAARH